MAGEVKPQGIFLAFQPLFFGPLAHTGHVLVGIATVARLEHFTEHIHHTDGFVTGLLTGLLHGLIDAGHQLSPAGAKLVHGAAPDQRFHGALVDLFQVNASAKIENILIGLAIATTFHDALNRALAQAFDSTEAIHNLAFVVDGKGVFRTADVWHQKIQFHVPALFYQRDHLVGVLHIGSQYRGHEFCRVMGFQPECLVGHQCIGGGVGFVEAVAGKLLYQVKDVFGQGRVDPVLLTAIQEKLLLLGHFLGLFLTHGAPQHVRITKGITGHHLGDLHDLLLVQDNPVGGLQNRLQAFILVIRMREGHGLAAVLTVDKVVHHARLQRPRPEQGHEGDHVFQ